MNICSFLTANSQQGFAVGLFLKRRCYVMGGRYEVRFRYKTTSKTSRGSVSSTMVNASSASDARNQVIASHSSGNGITVISVVKKR